jgi:predicted HTH domain antitoxin
MRPETAQKQLKEELAVHLFQHGFLSLGKALQLAEMAKWDFDKKLRELKSRQHYPQGNFEEDRIFRLSARKGNEPKCKIE